MAKRDDVLSLIDAVISLIPKVIDAARSARRKPDPNRPPPRFGRPHHWNLNKPPECVYCETRQTLDNKDLECPGPLRTPR